MASPPLNSDCPISSLLDTSQQSERERRDFQSKLVNFPHTFQMQRQHEWNVKRLNFGLQSALNVGYQTTLETARACNLLAYSLHRLGYSDQALGWLEYVLNMEDQRHNLVTLANKAIILWDLCRFSRAETQVVILQNIQKNFLDFPYLKVLAQAELAFSYTRLSPRFSCNAVEMFREVIPMGREPEVLLWRFGLALTRRRAMTQSPTLSEDKPEDLWEFFVEITKRCVSRNLKAKTYGEMANLLFCLRQRSESGYQSLKAGMDPKEACCKALELDDTDKSVLCNCGIVFRRCGQPEKARELLEKLLKVRPSCRAYHHLGMAYKALATKEKNKTKVNCDGQQLLLASPPRPLSASEGSDHCYAAPGTLCYRPTGGTADPDLPSGHTSSQSPVTGVASFSLADKFVREALDNFQKASDVSDGENVHARYDLALLLKSTGDLEKAKQNFLTILNRPQNPSTEINASEQLALILGEQAESESDEAKRKDLVQDSKALFLHALKLAGAVFLDSPSEDRRLGEQLLSFSALLKQVEDSDDDEIKKHKEKARLFQLIRDNKKTQQLLQEIEDWDPQQADDPEHLKMRIEVFVQMNEFGEAKNRLDILMCTSSQQTRALTQGLGDKYVLKIYVLAAFEALKKGQVSVSPSFRAAFLEAVNTNSNHNSDDCSSSDSDSAGSSDGTGNQETWDISIIFSDSAESDATAVRQVLAGLCGLRVSCMDRDAPCNKLELEGELSVMKRSSQVVFVPGPRADKKLRFFAANAAKRASTVTLVEENWKVPSVLKACRSLPCNPGLFLSLKAAACGDRTPSVLDAVKYIFSFLVNVQLNDS